MREVSTMSVSPPKADICIVLVNVGLVPYTDARTKSLRKPAMIQQYV